MEFLALTAPLVALLLIFTLQRLESSLLRQLRSLPNRPSRRRPTDTGPTGTGPTDTGPTETRPTDTRPTNTRPTNTTAP